MNSYTAYGLHIKSVIPIPHLFSTTEKASLSDSVEVDFPDTLPEYLLSLDNWHLASSELDAKDEPSLANDITRPSCKVWKKDQWTKISYHRDSDSKLTFYISAIDRKIICQRSKEIPFSDAESFLIGPVLGCLHRLMGNFCLHASVLSYKGRAFALVGAKGAGKSTTSAALLEAGATLISDDIAVISQSETSVTVTPGYPAVRLLPKSLAQYSLDLDNWSNVLSVGNKKIIPLPNSELSWKFDSSNRPLEAIYILQPRGNAGSNVLIQNLSSAKALIELAPQTFARYIMSSPLKAQEFRALGRLIGSVNVRTLTCPNDLKVMPQLTSAILSDFSSASTD